ncbi:MAG: hypothetical protein ABR587_13945 [Candidatus Binatia bacterium]
MSTRWMQGLAPVLALVACIAWVHAPALRGPAHLTAHHDNLDGAAPLRLEAARQWKSGQVPLWNPWKRTGMPLLADTTAGAIYPFNYPFLFVSPGTGGADSSVFRAMDQVAALHAVMAGVFMFVFLRVIGLGAAAGVLGGLVYACSGTMGWFAAWYIQIQNSVVWLPLILAAVHRIGTGSARRAAWIGIGGGAVALQFFAGFPETSFYSALIAIGYAFSLTRSTRWWQPSAAVAGVYVAGLLLAAVQLFPSLELQSLSRRPASLSLEVFQSLPASASMVWNWALPSAPAAMEFPPLAAYHFGAAAVVAAFLGLLFGLFSRTAAFFVVVLLIGFVLSIGADTPVSGWLHRLPGFGAFRHPFKHLFEVSLAIAALAGLGAEQLMRRRGSARWPLTVVAVAVVASCLSLRANQRVLVAANPAGVDTSGSRPDVLTHMEPGWRVLTQRHFFQPRDPAFLVGDYPSQFAVPAVHGAGPFLWTPLADATGMVEEETTLRRELFDSRDHTLALLSCRYVMQTRHGGKLVPALGAAWSLVVETPDARLMETRDALARVRFVDAARCSDAQTIRTTLAGGSVDPAAVALLDCSRGEREGSGNLSPATALALRITDERAGHLELATEVPDDGHGFLVLSQADYPGWRAFVDDVETPIHRVHGLVQGIDVPGGTSQVKVDYAPWSVRLGAATSAATLLVLLLLAGLPRRAFTPSSSTGPGARR